MLTLDQARAIVDAVRYACPADHEKRLKPLDVASSLAWWEASTTGSKEAFAKKVEAQNKIDEALANRETFARLKALEERRKEIDDPVLARPHEDRIGPHRHLAATVGAACRTGFVLDQPDPLAVD